MTIAIFVFLIVLLAGVPVFIALATSSLIDLTSESPSRTAKLPSLRCFSSSTGALGSYFSIGGGRRLSIRLSDSLFFH